MIAPVAAPDAAVAGEGLGRQWRDFVLMLVLTLALATAGVTGYGLANRTNRAAAPPATDSPDAGFARDMQVHHGQAVLMASIARDRTAEPSVRYLAYDILTSQQAQIGMMQAWLAEWGLTQTDSDLPPMRWMVGEHGGHGQADLPTQQATDVGMTRPLPDGRMPGMATAADVTALRTLAGRAAEIRFLQLMIPHHRGGVAMAEACIRLCQRPSLRQLAEGIAAGQAAEIRAMTAMLTARGARA